MKNKNRIKKPFYKQAFPMVVFILLIVYTISFIVPMLWAFITSMKWIDDFNGHLGVLESAGYGPNYFGLPRIHLYKKTIDSFGPSAAEYFYKTYPELKNWTIFTNYIRVNSLSPYGAVRRLAYTDASTGITWTVPKLLGETLLYAIGSTVITTASHAITAYIAARYGHHKIAAILYPIVIVTMLLPIVGNLPSEIEMMHKLLIYDEIWGLWLMKGGFLGTNFLIFYATFKSISWEYAEAAFVDGASHYRVLFQIMIPLAATSMGALALITFITYWNDWRVTLQYMPSHVVIAYALYYLQEDTSTQEGFDVCIKLAGSMSVALPMLLLFIIFKNKLMGNLTIGGIKG